MLNCKLSHSLVYLCTNCIAYIVYIIVYTRSLFRFRFVCFPFLSHCATRYSELSRTKASARFTSLQYGLFLFLFIKYILLSSLPVIFWSNHFAICSLIHLQNFLFSSWESIVYPRTNSPFSLQFFRNSRILAIVSEILFQSEFAKSARLFDEISFKKKKRSWKKLMQHWLKTNTLHRMFSRFKGTMREREREREGKREKESLRGMVSQSLSVQEKISRKGGEERERVEVGNKKFSRATLKDYLRPLTDKRVIVRVF